MGTKFHSFIVVTIKVILVIAFFFKGHAFAEDNLVQWFASGNSAYEQGNYQKAADYYQKIVEAGGISGGIYYNLGNSYFRLGKLGHAIFYYKKALMYIPANADLRFNLDYVSARAVDKITENVVNTKSLLLKVNSWVPVSLQQGLYFFAALSILFWGMLSIALWRWSWLRNIAYVCAFLWVLVGGVCALKTYANSVDWGVVTAKSANVYSATGKDNVILFTLHEGSEFEIMEKLRINEINWFQIELKDGKRGWIKQLEVITNTGSGY
ncbi:MAG: tetratricopeptide repeat protein [Oligoflexia bacterium]|nr:tetratricopeptide repeat protein [Oligoflexia bacterium]